MNYKLIFLGLLLLFTSQAFAYVTDTNLVSWYKFDATTGDANDSFSTKHLTQAGTVPSQTGLIYNARGVFSNSNYFSNSNVLSVNKNVSFTYSGWIKRTESISTDQRIFYMGGANSGDFAAFVSFSSTNKLTFEIDRKAVNPEYTQTWGTDINLNEWTHVAFTYNGTNRVGKGYVNGIERVSATANDVVFGTGAYLSVGAYPSWSNAFTSGYVDETGVWSRVLSATDVNELYNNGIGLTYCTGSFLAACPSITTDFNYAIRKDLNKIILTDTSSTIENVSKTSWTWTSNGSTISTAQDYNLTATQLTDYNICLHVDTNQSDVNGDKCYQFNTGDWTPPTTTFSSFQVPNTTDQNITLTCTDNNSGCKTINYKIDNNPWFYGVFDYNYFIFNGNEYTATTNLTWVTVYTKVLDRNNQRLNYLNAITGSVKPSGSNITNLTTARMKINFMDGSFEYSSEISKRGTEGNTYSNFPFIITTKNKDVNSIEFQLKYGDDGSTGTAYLKDVNILYVSKISSIYSFSFLFSGAGDHNIQYFSTDNSDNNETTKTSTFTTYGNARFKIKDQNSGLDLNGTQINFNGSDYVSGTNIYDFNLQELTSTNTSYLFTISKSGYSTRYYQIDLNYFSSFDVNFALIPDSVDADVPFKVYETDETTIFPNTFVEVKDSDTNYTVGRLKTNATGEVTFNLRADDSNYISLVDNGAFTYVPVTVTILYPKNEETLAQIDGNWEIDITQNLYASYTNLNAPKIIYLLPNTSLPYNIKISDDNGDYFSRTYAKQYPGNPLTDTLQPYLVTTSTGLLTTITTKDASTNTAVPNITIKIFKYISGLGRTLVEQLNTDSKGQALALLVLNGEYEFEAYNEATFIKTYNITATSSTIIIYLYTSGSIPDLNASGYNASFTPTSTGINKLNVGVATFTATIFNYAGLNTTYAVTLIQNGVTLDSEAYTGTDLNKTWTLTRAWSDINKGTIQVRITTTSGYGFQQTYNINDSFGTNYNILNGLQTGLRSDIACPVSGVCFPLMIIGILISIGLVLYASILMGGFNGQASGLIFVISMILFAYLNWVPYELVVAIVLIALAFIVNERRN